MAISIKVGAEANASDDNKITLKLKVRKTIDGNIMIMDHNKVDIVIVPEKKKVIAFAKSSFQDDVYACQDRLFNYLASKGTISRETVQSGDVYGSMQAQYPEAVGGTSATELVTFTIGKFIEEERPHMEMEEYLEKEFEEKLSNPDEEESTELGEISHAEKKGTIDSQNMRRYNATGLY